MDPIGKIKGRKIFEDPRLHPDRVRVPRRDNYKKRPVLSATITDDKGNLRQIPNRIFLKMPDDGWILRNTLIWYKTNAKPENGRIKKWGTSYEYIFFFVRSMDYWFDMDKIRVPYTTEPTRHAPRHHKTTKTVRIILSSGMTCSIGLVRVTALENSQRVRSTKINPLGLDPK